MTTRADNQRRELAHRTNNGIEVALFWSEPTDQVIVEISDTRTAETIEFEVAGADALDAFHHPYAYAYARSQGAHVAIGEAVAT